MSVLAMARGKRGRKRSLPLRFIAMIVLAVIIVFAVGFIVRFIGNQFTSPTQTVQDHTGRGTELYRQGDIAGAIEEYKKAARIDAKRFDVQTQLALCYQIIGDMTNSAKAYNKAIKINPKAVDLYRNLAALEMRAGDLKSAEKHLTKALKIDPKYVSGHAGLGDLYVAERKFAAAANEYKKALSGATGSNYKVTLLNLLGLSYANMGLKTQAVATFKRALAIDPNNVSAKGNLRVYGK